jgi:hypothetical protein
MPSSLAHRIARRFLYAAEGGKSKKMVIMIGPPAAGKGFFLGEPEKDKGTGETKKYKTEKGEERATTFGYKLPKSTKGLFSDEDVPDRPNYDESDNHLRAIQFEEARKHFDALKKAHGEGKEAFDAAMKDMWYETKDGKRVELAPLVKFEEFPDNPRDFHSKANTEFYVSMRGWHDDWKKSNPETGKPKERFKDQARHRFDDNVGNTTERDDTSGFMIVDSAGEDIDAQDFKGQIEHAKANGYEVSVIFLHPEKADTELSNLARNRVNKKRMVDQADIDNWYERNKDALKAIQSADPDNFVHYRKGPPDSDPVKAKAARQKARDLMERLKDMDAGEREAAAKEINKALYGTPYELQKETSYGRTLKGLPKKPEKDIANAVEAMNEEAAKRASPDESADKSEKKTEKGDDEEKPKRKPKEHGDRGSTRMKFLEEVGDRMVPNPNFDGSKAVMPSNPRQRKIRNLPWEHQKKFYEQWSRSKTGAIVYLRYLEASMAVDATKDKEESPGFIKGWMKEVATKLMKTVKVEGYVIEVRPGEGPVVFVVVKGGEGDVTALRKAQPAITKILDEAVKSMGNNLPKGVKPSVRSSTKGDDMVITCEFVFP